MRHYRQGDVLITEVPSIPKGAKAIPREGGKVVLAHGEVTGHSHAIAAKSAKFVGVVNDQVMRRYLEAPRDVVLRHEEHAEIRIAKGTYEITIQREYAPGAIRNVAD